jgi:hypothetical protein
MQYLLMDENREVSNVGHTRSYGNQLDARCALASNTLIAIDRNHKVPVPSRKICSLCLFVSIAIMKTDTFTKNIQVTYVGFFLGDDRRETWQGAILLNYQGAEAKKYRVPLKLSIIEFSAQVIISEPEVQWRLGFPKYV